MADRVCRACGGRYEYPARGRAATRLHCEACAVLDANVRRAFENVRRQMAQLRAEVRNLSRRAGEPTPDR